jgi:hypothetical protein
MDLKFPPSEVKHSPQSFTFRPDQEILSAEIEPQMTHRGSLAKTSLVAAFAEVCFGVLAIAPGAFGLARVSTQLSTFDWVYGGLVFFASFAIAAFLWMVYRDEASLNASRSIGLAALIAAFLLGLENLPQIYATIMSVFRADDVFLWKNHPLRYASHVLVPTIPSFAVVSLLVFLVVVYRTSLGVSAQSAEHCRNLGLRNASFAAFGASIGALVALIYAVAAFRAGHTWSLSIRLLLRLASIVSLGIFFLLVGLRHNESEGLVENPSK